MNTDMMKDRMYGFKRGEMHHHDKKCHEQFHDIKKAGVMRVVHALIINVFGVDVKRNESCEGLMVFKYCDYELFWIFGIDIENNTLLSMQHP
jgi:hypothetical protein